MDLSKRHCTLLLDFLILRRGGVGFGLGAECRVPPLRSTAGSPGRSVPPLGTHAAKATEWLRKAAEQGNTVVQFYLSDPYSEGSGAEQDYRKHTSTYRQQHRLAAASMSNLDKMYHGV